MGVSIVQIKRPRLDEGYRPINALLLDLDDLPSELFEDHQAYILQQVSHVVIITYTINTLSFSLSPPSLSPSLSLNLLLSQPPSLSPSLYLPHLFPSLSVSSPPLSLSSPLYLPPFSLLSPSLSFSISCFYRLNGD